MFPADLFHDRRLYEATSGWLAQQGATEGQGKLAGVAWTVFHRAFRVLHHIGAGANYAESAATQLVQATLGEVASLDGVRVWSPLVEVAIVEVVAALADLRILQNDTSLLMLGASADRDVPTSFRDVAKALARAEKKSGSRARWVEQVPSSERRLMLDYWTNYGERVAQYRDLDQHFGVLVHAGVFREVTEGPRVQVLLPDNPETKSQTGLTFGAHVDGLQFVADEFDRLHDLLETFAAGRCSTRGSVPRLGLQFRPPLAFNPGEAKLHAVAVMRSDGSETALIGSTDDRAITIRTVRREQAATGASHAPPSGEAGPSSEKTPTPST